MRRRERSKREKVLRTWAKVENGLSNAWDFTKRQKAKGVGFHQKDRGWSLGLCQGKTSDGWNAL